VRPFPFIFSFHRKRFQLARYVSLCYSQQNLVEMCMHALYSCHRGCIVVMRFCRCGHTWLCCEELKGESVPGTSQVWLDDAKLGSRLMSSIRRGLNCSKSPSCVSFHLKQTVSSLPKHNLGFINFSWGRMAKTVGYTISTIIRQQNWSPFHLYPHILYWTALS